MTNSTSALSKVIVYDSDPAYEVRIKEFCDKHNLLAVKSQPGQFMEVLKSNVDLGALFLSSDLRDKDDDTLLLYQKIHQIRPELPIILRDAGGGTVVANKGARYYCASYTMDKIEDTCTAINDNIFNKQYPNALIRGIEEITTESLRYLFPNTVLESSFPYLVNDRIIYGELFTLIPLESIWCRGYMMLQADQKNIVALIKKGTVRADTVNDFRVVNDVLGEITNMVWGKIKNRFISEKESAHSSSIHVPIIVNHQNNYITFGAGTSQLCFKHTLTQKDGDQKSVHLYQKFVFNLSWHPEKFHENNPSVDDLLASGVLELF